MRKPLTTLEQPIRALRLGLGMSQTTFWARIGVTQSGGARYEAAGKMPLSIASLVRLLYIEGVDISRIRKSDWQVIKYLNQEAPDLLARLKQASRKPVSDAFSSN